MPQIKDGLRAMHARVTSCARLWCRYVDVLNGKSVLCAFAKIQQMLRSS